MPKRSHARPLNSRKTPNGAKFIAPFGFKSYSTGFTGLCQYPRTVRNASLARSAASCSAPADGPAPRISRELDGTTLRTADPKTLASPSAVPPWAPSPGASNGPRMSRFSSVDAIVAPTTAPNDPSAGPASPRSSAFSSTQAVQHRAGDGRPVDRPRRLELRTLRIRGQREDEQPRAGRARLVDGRLQRPEPQVRADRQRVTRQRPLLRQVRRRVAGHRGPDVTALRVDDHQRAGVPQPDRRLLEDGDPRRPEALEERGLRLEHRDPVGQRVDHAVRERRQTLRGVREAPGIQQVRRAGRCRRTAGRGCPSPPGAGRRTVRCSCLLLMSVLVDAADQAGPAVDQPGVHLHQAGPGVEQPGRVRAARGCRRPR